MKERAYYLDVARVICMFAVIVIHIECINWYDPPFGAYPWMIYNFWDCISRFCVPVFLMISGFLFLNPEKDFSVKKLYTKNIARLLTAFFFWSFLYAIISSGFATQRVFSKEIGKLFIEKLFYGHYHMWYLYVMLGMYIITPALRAIAKDRKATEYFLIASFLISYVLPTLQITSLIFPTVLYTNRIDWHLLSGYSFYYLMGYYIGSDIEEKKKFKFWAIVGIIGFVTLYAGTSIMCITEQYGDIKLHEYNTISVAMYSCGMFACFRHFFSKVNPDTKIMRVVRYLSTISFGIYLANDFGIIVFRKIGFVPALFNPILSVPLLALIDFAIAIVIASIVYRIPWFNKHVM